VRFPADAPFSWNRPQTQDTGVVRVIAFARCPNADRVAGIHGARPGRTIIDAQLSPPPSLPMAPGFGWSAEVRVGGASG
jgi:hypothetical protein